MGVRDTRTLKSIVEERRKAGISLSTLGFGTGNLNDEMMEQVADAGDGAYSYVDSLMEGHKVLVNEMTSTLATIAQDVKIQVEFNPNQVQEYRLIGYENRQLAREDFNNDKVDAGDIGAGHTVTAIYELTMKHASPTNNNLRYTQKPQARVQRELTANEELAFIKLRYKRPGEKTSQLIERPVVPESFVHIQAASVDMRFATAVAGAGQLFRGGRYTRDWGFQQAQALARESVGKDPYGYRAEFVRLMELAQSLSFQAPKPTASE